MRVQNLDQRPFSLFLRTKPVPVEISGSRYGPKHTFIGKEKNKPVIDNKCFNKRIYFFPFPHMLCNVRWSTVFAGKGGKSGESIHFPSHLNKHFLITMTKKGSKSTQQTFIKCSNSMFIFCS